MADSGTRIPLDLVTGFLGSGKTTLINAVLREPAFAGTVVIVNEFGEVGLDQLLVGSATDGVVLLDSGCLCCAVSGSLRNTLIDLFSRRAASSLPAFRRIIVETSGLANPAPMIASLLGDSALAPRCYLAQVLTLVDAVHGLSTLERYAEARRQVALADRVLIGKSDIVDSAQLALVMEAVRVLNPQALAEPWCSTDSPASHFGPLAANGQRCISPDAWLRGPVRVQYGAGEPTHGEAFAQVTTHTLRVPEPLDWSAYSALTDGLRRRFGARMLRCKGLVPIGPEGDPWVVQGVQGYFARPERLVEWPGEGRHGYLVCIGEGIARDDLDETFRSITS